MILRSLAALVFTAGAVALITGLALIGMAPGVPLETRHLRDMKERSEEPAHPRPVTIDDFGALPHGVPVAEYSALESRGVQLEGWLEGILWSNDGDVHFEVATRDPGPANRDTVYVTAEIPPAWREGTRAWSYDSLVAALRPGRGGLSPWDSGPRRARFTGWLLYDWQYDAIPSTWSLQYGSPRRTGWEIHPLTKIELWNAATASWQELAR